jgi:4-amino-4-deoxy-L-arabinose transferase-like glycosyltransferase
MLALRRYGGPELWREWFWNNHFVRFTGQAVQLGHRNWAGYYLAVLPLYILPWLAAWLIGLGGAARRLWRKESPGLDWTFLFWWGLGGLLLLTLSSTKREIYLAPLLPAFALMAVPALREPVSAGVRWAGKIWTWLVLAALALLIVAPVLGVGLGVPAKERHLYALVALGFSAIAGIAFFQRNQPWLRTLLLITALGYIAALSILAPLADRVKSYGPAFRQLARQVQAAPAARVAAWQFDETSRAGFNYYCGLVFPAVSNTNELAAILAGTHPRFDGVLCVSSSSKKFPPAGVALPDWRVAGEVSMGKNRRLQWIVGQRLYLPDPKIPRGETE